MSFHPVIQMPPDSEIFDFTRSYDKDRLRGLYGIGRYDEKRSGMYTSKLFTGDPKAVRDVHVGIDLAAPIGTSVHAFDDGEVHLTGINDAVGDYGGTVVTKHLFDGRDLYVLHGHLSHDSILLHEPGEKLSRGDIIGWIGDENENGGWNPHLHFQLSWLKPELCDLPGTVSDQDRDQALKDYPDPRLVLGPLY